MKASETTLQPIIEGAKQYIVPLFQRPYCWKKEQWQVLWDDLVELCESDSPRSHFIGSIVTMQTVSVPEGVPKYLLIDGQQRLTTIFLILAVLRDSARGRGQEELAAEINQTLLVNPFKKGGDHFKLLPTQGDRESFQALIHQSDQVPNDRIGTAYSFFDRKLKQSKIDEKLFLRNITESLVSVSIVLDRDDNPYLVFESLNAKGEELTQADLIRNFFLLKIHSDQQEEMHARFWQPMQEMLDNRLTEFIRHFLMRQGLVVRSNAIYFTLKERLGQGDALELLRVLARSAAHYKKLLEPAEEPDPQLREAWMRLNLLEVTTAYPFLLNCYDEFERGELTIADFRAIARMIENFVIRRFVCGVPTNQLKNIFAPLYNQIHSGAHSSLLEGVRQVLSGRGYPKDTEFRSRLMDAKLYGGGDRQVKTKLILESIDRAHGHKEAIDYNGLTIEHVMPQTLTDDWRADLGENWEVTHELMLHTLGNLTLTGYNPELSNANYSRKRDILCGSHISLNSHFRNSETWGEDAIDRRADVLAGFALRIWPYFGVETEETRPETDAREKPRRLKFLGRSFDVKTWRDVLEETLNAIEEHDPERFREIARSMPKLLGPDLAEFNDRRQLKCGLFANVNLSAKGITRFCLRALEAAGLDLDEWVVETG